jgi:hypothetical protein
MGETPSKTVNTHVKIEDRIVVNRRVLEEGRGRMERAKEGRFGHCFLLT